MQGNGRRKQVIIGNDQCARCHGDGLIEFSSEEEKYHRDLDSWEVSMKPCTKCSREKYVLPYWQVRKFFPEAWFAVPECYRQDSVITFYKDMLGQLWAVSEDSACRFVSLWDPKAIRVVADFSQPCYGGWTDQTELKL